MRMRRKKNRVQRFENCAGIAALTPAENKGRWRAVFNRDCPLHVEVGCGKGGFVLAMAEKYPAVSFIAIEKCLDVLILAMEKVKAAGLKNVIFISGDAQDLCDLFEEGEVDRLYLNFSDPWPKAKQAKRRLTYRTFLEKYRQVLKSGGELHFKTDNRPLFDFSLEEFEGFGLTVTDLTYDLHHSGFQDNVMTEYERNFSQKGVPINRCVVHFEKPQKKENVKEL